RRQVTLTHSGDVLVHDQYKVNLPYIDDSFEIRKLSSVFLQIKSYIGLQILYDWKGLRLYLEADAQWKDDTIGLCGTFNGNTQDDFLSPVGVPETTPQLFGNSWKTSSSCSPGYDSSSIDPCDVHLQAAAYATEACSIITKELFAPCYTYLSPLPYFEQCRRDTCKCGQICMCSALSHYAHLCHRFGVEVNFRNSVPECALSCEDTKEYSTCVSTCGRSCRAFSVPEACDGDCVEGCTCPSGMYLNIKTDRCVPQNECPCYFHGIDYPPGENIITSFGKCHCRNGMMNCEDDTDHDCPEDQIYVNCSHPPTMELDRERTCENQLLNISVSTQLSCFSGCTCPTGLFKYGDMCFKPNECPCSWKGKEYFPGDKVISSCHTCICSHGSFKCNFHPCPSMCTAYGDRHYRTFDGLSFDYVGNCKVYLVKSSSITSFSVIIENVNCFNIGIICRKYVSINVGKSFIIFDDDTGDPSHLSYIDKLQQVYIWKAGFFTIVHFPSEHITVMWDQRTTVHVETGPQWQGELTGLCGNFDSKTINEMRTPEHFELTNAQEFGSSWAAIECADSSDIRHPCILNPLREAFAKKESSPLHLRLSAISRVADLHGLFQEIPPRHLPSPFPTCSTMPLGRPPAAAATSAHHAERAVPLHRPVVTGAAATAARSEKWQRPGSSRQKRERERKEREKKGEKEGEEREKERKRKREGRGKRERKENEREERERERKRKEKKRRKRKRKRKERERKEGEREERERGKKKGESGREREKGKREKKERGERKENERGEIEERERKGEKERERKEKEREREMRKRKEKGRGNRVRKKGKREKRKRREERKRKEKKRKERE
ncbi:otogelin, partial [Crotalus adamanteus]